jgi:hypothetical protein
MVMRRAFSKGIERQDAPSVGEIIDKAKADKAAETLAEQTEAEEAAVAKRDEMTAAIFELDAQVHELVEMLALMKHPNQRPALRQIILETPKPEDGHAVRVATLANQIERARTEFKKGGA